MARYYKNILSGYNEISAPDELYHPENLGKRLAIDETSLVHGELYSIITNKDTGKLVALMQGTKARDITAKIAQHLPLNQRMAVEEVTLDMDTGFDWVTRSCFLNAEKIVDRFHVQKLVMEGVQAVRIIERQKFLQERREAKKSHQAMPKEIPYENGDTPRELLARSRYLLFKPMNKWTVTQEERASILFREHPDLAIAYCLSQELKVLFDSKITRSEALPLLQDWCRRCKLSNILEMDNVSSSVLRHEGRILNYWNNRATNAYAESFNAKLKHFRAMLRGIRDIHFFLFRCEKYFS